MCFRTFPGLEPFQDPVRFPARSSFEDKIFKKLMVKVELQRTFSCAAKGSPDLTLWCVCFRDSDSLLSCGSGNSLFLHAPPATCSVCLDLEDGSRAKSIRCIALPPAKSEHYATCSFDGSVTIRSSVSHQALHTLSGHGNFHYSLILFLSLLLILLLLFSSLPLPFSFYFSLIYSFIICVLLENEVKCVAFSPDATLLASAGRDKTVWIWDALEEYECAAVLQHHSQDVKCVAFSPFNADGLSVLASGSYDDHVNVYLPDQEDIDEWSLIHRINMGSTVWNIAFDPAADACNARMCVACDDGSLGFWSIPCAGGARDPELLQTLHLGQHLVSCCWVYSDWIVACGEEFIYLVIRDSQNGIWRLAEKVVGHNGRDVNCVDVRKDADASSSPVFASCGDDKCVRVWRVEGL